MNATKFVVRGCCVWVAALALALGLFAMPGSSAAQEKKEEKKEEKKDDKDKKEEKKPALPLKSDRKIEFTTDEGTWLSLDVSPDGKTIVFEMLGDIYTLEHQLDGAIQQNGMWQVADLAIEPQVDAGNRRCFKVRELVS